MEEIVEKIRSRVSAVDPNGPRKVKGVFQLNIKSGDDITKTITLDLNKLEVFDDNVDESADVSVDFDGEALSQVIKRDITFTDAVANGKAVISGDLSLANSLAGVVCSKPDADSE